jgi:hypothetical protein
LSFIKPSVKLYDNPILITLGACWHCTAGLLCSREAQVNLPHTSMHTWPVTGELCICEASASPAPHVLQSITMPTNFPTLIHSR